MEYIALMKEFSTLVKAVISDSVISTGEARALLSWIHASKEFSITYPFRQIAERLETALGDADISPEESRDLIALLVGIQELGIESTKKIKTSKSKVDPDFVMPKVLEFDLLENGFSWRGKNICLTGVFAYPRSEIETMLESGGAVIKTSVSGKLDYLIVGLLPTDEWKFGNYGLKIENAACLRAAGNPIKIISECNIAQSCWESLS